MPVKFFDLNTARTSSPYYDRLASELQRNYIRDVNEVSRHIGFDKREETSNT
jgi:hypothetical protein